MVACTIFLEQVLRGKRYTAGQKFLMRALKKVVSNEDMSEPLSSNDVYIFLNSFAGLQGL